MIQFELNSNIFLKRKVRAFSHDVYIPGEHKKFTSLENVIIRLKNTYDDSITKKILGAKKQIFNYVVNDLPLIIKEVGFDRSTVIVSVPRAKSYYKENRLQFQDALSNAVDYLGYPFVNGVFYIKRIVDTATTHLKDNEGKIPYPGITNDTCTISDLVKDKDIILIDDIYTQNVNIDEDCIQALFDKGAKNVVFYSIGKTVRNGILNL